MPPDSSNKENAVPGNPQTPPPAPAPADSPPTSERVPDSQPQSSTQQAADSLPPPLALLLNSIRSAIQTFFMQKPPHTIQRLAELILRPTAHYKTLPAYLRAVDRVVSVTSAADVFPFNPPPNTPSQPNGLMHPTNSAGTYLAPDYASGLGSDESLGGALLTPIPWLTTTPLEGEGQNALTEGMYIASIMSLPCNALFDLLLTPPEAVSTQPQETDTGVTTSLETADGDATAQRTSASPPAESADEVPHARGPPVVGVEDLGLQDGRGVEMDLGEKGIEDAAAGQDAAGSATEAPTAEPSGAVSASGTADQDGDILLEDSQAKKEDRPEDTTAASQTGEERAQSSGEAAEASEPGKKE